MAVYIQNPILELPGIWKRWLFNGWWWQLSTFTTPRDSECTCFLLRVHKKLHKDTKEQESYVPLCSLCAWTQLLRGLLTKLIYNNLTILILTLFYSTFSHSSCLHLKSVLPKHHPDWSKSIVLRYCFLCLIYFKPVLLLQFRTAH